MKKQFNHTILIIDEVHEIFLEKLRIMNLEIISPFLVPTPKVLTFQSEEVFHQVRGK